VKNIVLWRGRGVNTDGSSLELGASFLYLE